MATIDDLKAWFERDIRFATWDENVQTESGDGKRINLKFYTDINEYAISIEVQEDGNAQISGTAKSRKARPGLAESRVRQLVRKPAKPLTPGVWRRLLGAIVGLELVRVRRREAAEQIADEQVKVQPPDSTSSPAV